MAAGAITHAQPKRQWANQCSEDATNSYSEVVEDSRRADPVRVRAGQSGRNSDQGLSGKRGDVFGFTGKGGQKPDSAAATDSTTVRRTCFIESTESAPVCGVRIT